MRLSFGEYEKLEHCYGKKGETILIIVEDLPENIIEFTLEIYFDHYLYSLSILCTLMTLKYGGTHKRKTTDCQKLVS